MNKKTTLKHIRQKFHNCVWFSTVTGVKLSRLRSYFGGKLTRETGSAPYKAWEQAKQCALIAVDEILNDDWYIATREDLIARKAYWQQVKQEIEKQMNDKQQTAVQWLHEQLATAQSTEVTEWLWAKALEMERKQHVDTFTYAWIRAIIPGAKANVGDYFTDTYQNKQ